MNIRVECRSEYQYAQRPIAIHWEGQRLVVAEVLNEWQQPDGKHFRLLTDDGRVFELTYLPARDSWEAHPS